ncbi:MAG TPA: YihY/virulence factor BrkB family protein [Solirubrobacterales bacterium]|nr:YihY/virulence factor BrkB family protein [Solirubrobacterales bacterium]
MSPTEPIKPGEQRSLPVALLKEFRSKQLLIYATAIAFRALLAAIPTTLFVVALLGSLNLEELWRDEAAPEIRDAVSQPVFTVINDAVTRVLESQNGFWLTVGAVLAIAAMVSVVDAVTRTLNRIHDAEETRGAVERLANAVAIGTASALLIVGAFAAVWLGPIGFRTAFGDSVVVEVVSFVVRWAVAAGLLVAAVILMVRVAPDLERPMRRVSIGAAITVSGWLVATLIFSLYLSNVADYGSIFGHLATIYIGVQYVALSAIVYVAGLAIDGVAARRRQPPEPARAESADGRREQPAPAERSASA